MLETDQARRPPGPTNLIQIPGSSKRRSDAAVTRGAAHRSPSPNGRTARVSPHGPGGLEFNSSCHICVPDQVYRRIVALAHWRMTSVFVDLVPLEDVSR